MPILASEIQLVGSQTVNNLSTNGGGYSLNLVQDGVKNNVFADVPKAERLAGSTTFRKVFYKLSNPNALVGFDPKLFVMKPTNAGDAVVISQGSAVDTQADITPTQRRFGAGFIVGNVAAGAATVTVTPEQSLYAVFQAGDMVAITARNETNTTAPIDYYTITAVSNSGSDKAITLDRGLTNAVAQGYVVSSCIAQTTMSSVIYGWTAGSKTCDNTKIIFNNAGSINGKFTLTFSSATAFALTCDQITLNNYTGNTGADYSPENPNTAQPFFTLPPAFFNGAYEAGSTIIFSTTAATIGVWCERIIPAGTVYASANAFMLGFEVESE